MIVFENGFICFWEWFYLFGVVPPTLERSSVNTSITFTLVFSLLSHLDRLFYCKHSHYKAEALTFTRQFKKKSLWCYIINKSLLRAEASTIRRISCHILKIETYHKQLGFRTFLTSTFRIACLNHSFRIAISPPYHPLFFDQLRTNATEVFLSTLLHIFESCLHIAQSNFFQKLSIPFRFNLVTFDYKNSSRTQRIHSEMEKPL